MPSEIGIMDVSLTEAAKSDPVFGKLPETFKCLQWHSVRVAQAPDDAVVLAQSDVCSNQAMRVGERAWSMQYHMELDATTIPEWGRIPAYEDALARAHGEGALQRMADEAEANMADFEVNSQALYRGFISAIS